MLALPESIGKMAKQIKVPAKPNEPLGLGMGGGNYLFQDVTLVHMQASAQTQPVIFKKQFPE